MKYFIFLFFAAISSEITVQSVPVAGQEFNHYEHRPLNKINVYDGDSPDDGIIIIAAFRRSGHSRGKYKKVTASIKSTTEAIKTTTTAIKTTTEAIATTTEAITTTTKAIETTTEAIKTTTEAIKSTTQPIKTTTEEAVKVTTEKPVIVTKDVNAKNRRNQLSADDRRDDLWLTRKRVTRAPKAVPTKKAKVIVVEEDEEDYSVRRARYLFSQRLGK